MKRFFSRLVSVFKTPNKGKRSMKLEQRRRFFRPLGEGLEGRSLLATLSIGDPVPIDEEDGVLRFPVTLSGAAGGAFTVGWGTIAGGTATPATDYTPVTGTLSFAGTDGEIQYADVTVIDDDWVEATETVIARLTAGSLAGPGAANVALDPPLTAIGEIKNTDHATITVIAMDSGTAEENIDNAVRFDLELNHRVDADIEFSWTAMELDSMEPGIPATAGTDFVPDSDSETILAGDLKLAVPFEVTVKGDAIVELDELFKVSVGALNFSKSGIAGFVDFQVVDGNSINYAKHTIANDDEAYLNIHPIDDVDEDDGTRTVTVELVGRVDYEVVVQMGTLSGTATGGSDYGLGLEELRFDPSTSATQTKTYELTINEDDLVELATETFNVVISGVGAAGREASINPLTATEAVGIRDNDQAVISINDVLLTEGTHATALKAFAFTVTISKAVDTAFTFTYYTVGGDAAGGIDFVEVTTPVTVNVPANSTDPITITIYIYQDASTANDIEFENFEVRLGNLSAPGHDVIFGDAYGEGIIEDDD